MKILSGSKSKVKAQFELSNLHAMEYTENDRDFIQSDDANTADTDAT